ncbi:nucleoside hydrolase [Paenibacillus woosongensis]|uniref:Ribonucleoside hydrolase n=1 Tax=Paenibacillus woosongensis TaxID=307580 RepID=A0A7X3CMD9_9BACL|nr:nucleoside hydrolase [Paenibacillus woosongensis]MUG44067.1 ribonucleoside hydrolase [Paenibacillus woosongensis]
MTAAPRKIILDCDPGIDDAMAIILAAYNPYIDLLGITTVAGNVSVEKTTRNALCLCELMGIGHVPVAQGAQQPLVRKSVFADYVHGDSGLGGIQLPPPQKEVMPEHGVDFIVRTLMESEGDITLVAIGPLTNVALALRKQPEIAAKVQEIVIMGGGTMGNITPAAEFNFFADAEAAKVVFGCGAPITMIGLDLTNQAMATAEVKEQFAAVNNRMSRFILDLIEDYEQHNLKLGLAGATVHDPCCIAYCIDPSMFEAKRLRVDIETNGELTYGMSVIDMLGVTQKPANANVPLKLDQRVFWDLFVKTIREANGSED